MRLLCDCWNDYYVLTHCQVPLFPFHVFCSWILKLSLLYSFSFTFDSTVLCSVIHFSVLDGSVIYFGL